ncbi:MULTISPECIES: mannonate dehydratase [Paenibacillus]|uniref:mannonate dehydratase n=1 Tax=Paenibacillus TaxID=44249 RepID=UPI00203E26EA|nr:mannonate dehydratase [Paenibacillus camelliae]MCM3634664.1 mannonate dehydratase [Paenibacillus camelliae]
MRMTFRWFGEGNDPIPLSHIKQIPGTEGIVWALHDIAAGEEWPLERIQEVKRQADEAGFHIDVVESVNVHEDIKLGLPSRDRYIENYKKTIASLATVGVKVICYNFMPVFDWLRTNLYGPLEDGSTAMFYEKAKVASLTPHEVVAFFQSNSEFQLPGWEPERLAQLSVTLEAYQSVDEEKLWDNLAYFLEQIVPVAAEHGIRMAIHPDDPPYPLFGLPRIINSQESLRRLIKLVDHPSNGITLCSGSLGARPDNDIIAMIHEFADRIPFAHIRNVRLEENGDFIETSHRTEDGTVNIAGIMKAYYDVGFTGYARPDHGRHVWDEVCRPGYGLYDRGMGIMHLLGLWDAYRYADKGKLS